MSKKTLDRYDIIQRLQRKEINGTDAARLLSLSVRQTKRLKAAVARRGASGLIHGLRGKPSNHRIPDNEREKITAFLHAHYHDFGPTLAAEKLAERHGIPRDPSTIRDCMIAAGLWKPQQRRGAQEHRQWRQRRSAYGELVQFDGSYEAWLEDRCPACCLLAAIDDATGNIIHAAFVSDEGVFPVFTFWKAYVETHGKPRSIYMDRFSTYKNHMTAATENHELKTQFQRAMEELAIEPLFANSPQAKGRVERLFGTLQDRLIKELRLASIATIDDANHFLTTTFIPDFNKRFAVAPALPVNLHSPLTAKERTHLQSIFARKEERTVQNDFTISYNTQWYQLAKDQPVTVCKKDRITVEERLDDSRHFRLRGKELHVTPIMKRLRGRPAQKIWVLPATAAGLATTVAQMVDHLQKKQPLRTQQV